MREAINNALFVDSYNFGENEDETTDTPTVSSRQLKHGIKGGAMARGGTVMR